MGACQNPDKPAGSCKPRCMWCIRHGVRVARESETRVSSENTHLFDPYEQSCERCGVSYKDWAERKASPTCGGAVDEAKTTWCPGMPNLPKPLDPGIAEGQRGRFALNWSSYPRWVFDRMLKPEVASQFRVLSAAEAEARDREEVETLAARESRWLDEQGVTGYSVVIPPGPRSGKVPYLRHDATGARLVDFPPTGEGRRVARNVHVVNVAAGHPERTDWIHCAGCEADHAADQDFVRGQRCPLCKEATLPLKPPTLREWLGDRVSELGRWAEVLREQPVPAGCILEWRWHDGKLQSRDRRIGWSTLLPDGVVHMFDESRPYHGNAMVDGLEMALFTRHPDVKPEPRLTIACEDQYEVLP